MKKILRKKSFIILLIAAFFIIFARTVPQVSLVERAIVVGMGIDYDDGMYTVSTQIIKPVNASQSGGAQNSFGLEYATAKTVNEAVNKITQKTGLVVSLAQCNVLVLGKGVVTAQVFPCINYFVSTYQIPEQAVIVATAETALDIFRTKLVSNNISAFQIQSSLLSQQEYSVAVATILKDFILQYTSYSKAATITYLTKKPVNTDDKGATNSSSSDNQKLEEFDFTKSVVFIENRPGFVLDAEDTRAVNYIMKQIEGGSIEIEAADGLFNMNLKNNKVSKKIKLENGKAVVESKVKIKLVIAEAEYMNRYFSSNEITDKILSEISDKAKTLIETQILITYNKCKAENIDVYNLYDIIYSSKGLKWKEMASINYLEQVDFKVTVDIELSRR